MARVLSADSTGILPNPKQIGGAPAAIHAATSSSEAVGRSKVNAPTNGRSPPNSAHSAANPGMQASSYAWISSDPRSVIRHGDGLVAFGRPNSRR
ncbi:Uncharacterised protein [Mycobacteroides abscessus subsp. abscessus]|nr:Uncharacterised protein [Mycobacteroides abscessus subsp. abscessus]SIK56160.1 Uncharacterised protein [Mycobacteroides abscessus subsp. abscessus]SKU52536.1 Uncharacterised protein [Mycobacteroides abscessus subsp. abscessus]